MRDLVLTLIIFSALPVALTRPWIGILVFSWIGYMNPHRFTWGFAYSLPFAALVGLATIAGFLFTREKGKIPLNSMTIVWFCWIVWMNVTTPFALSPEWAIPEWERAMKIQVASLLTISLIQNRQRLNALIWVVALSVGFFGIKGGVFVLATGGNYLVWGPPGTFFGGNNGLAAALLMVMPLFWYLRMQAKSRWLRMSLLVAMLLIAASVLGSYSRGAWLALAAVSVYLVYKSRHKMLLAPILVISVLAAVSFLPERWFERLETIQNYEEDGSAMGRINAWGYGINVAKARPFVGAGFGGYTPENFQKYAPDPDDFHDAHSIYFEALGEHGFVGLVLFLLLGWLSLRQGNKIRRLTAGREDLQWAFDLISMVQAGLVGYAVAGAFLGLAYFDLYYHLLTMIVITRMLVVKQLKSSVADPVGVK